MNVVRLGRRAMGTSFEVLVCGDDETLLRAAAEEALALVDRLEDQMSLYLPTSELCRINATAAREEVRVEPGLFRLLTRAAELHAETGGAFDIAIAPLMAAWGFRGAGDEGAAGMRHVRLGENGTIRFLRKGVALDLGGIGKGYALDRAAALLRERGIESALLHGGTSTVYALGAPPDADAWTVGLVDPRAPDRRFGSLELRDQALSTSSSLGRVAEHEGKTVGHVLDPRRGRPVRRACAWALGRSAADTDALATAWLVRGATAARAYTRKHAGSGALVLDKALRCYGVEPELFEEPRGGLSRRDFMRGTAAAAAAFGVGLPTAHAQEEDDAPAAPAKEVKVAVVGLGDQGRLLLGQLARMKAVKVPAICDTNKAARRRGIELAGRDVETYETHDHLLDEEDVDAVVIATPTHTHAAIALAALAKGKHVFCEAPLAHTVDDCRRIVKAAEKAKKTFQTGHHRRASELYPHALTHIKSGAIGDILQVRAQWNRKQSWRKADAPRDKAKNWRLYRATSGGLPLEIGSHVFDLASWYLGNAVPEAVTGLGSLLKWKDGREVDDAVQVLVRYPGGVQLNLGASLINSYREEEEIVVGDAASILLTRQHKGHLFKEADTVAAGWEAYAKKEMVAGYRGIILDAEATKYKSHEEPEQLGPDADKADFFAELRQFLGSIRNGDPVRCDARAGMRAAVTGIVAAEAIAKRSLIEFTKDHFEV